MITIYSKPGCPWCDKAKSLLYGLNWDYVEKVLGEDYTKKDLRALVPKTLPLTVPQIFDDNMRIGGYTDLVEYLDMLGADKIVE